MNKNKLWIHANKVPWLFFARSFARYDAVILTNYIQSVVFAALSRLECTRVDQFGELVKCKLELKITAEIIFHILFACSLFLLRLIKRITHIYRYRIFSLWIKKSGSLIRFYHIIKFSLFYSHFSFHINMFVIRWYLEYVRHEALNFILSFSTICLCNWRHFVRILPQI